MRLDGCSSWRVHRCSQQLLKPSWPKQIRQSRAAARPAELVGHMARLAILLRSLGGVDLALIGHARLVCSCLVSLILHETASDQFEVGQPPPSPPQALGKAAELAATGGTLGISYSSCMGRPGRQPALASCTGI